MHFGRKLAIIASLCVIGATALSQQAGLTAVAGGTRPYTAATMWELKRLATPAIAPDGRQAVVAVSTHDLASGQETTNLWLVPTRPGRARPLTAGNANDHSPAWSPDGRWIAFVSRRGNDSQPQVYIIPVDGGEARRVTNVPTGAQVPKWFPDSQRIAFLSRVWPEATWQEMDSRLAERATARVSGRTWDRAPVSHWDQLLDDRSTHLYWIDIDGGAPQPVTAATGQALDSDRPGPGTYDLSPDGLEVAFAADSDPTGRSPDFDIYVMPVTGGEPRNLTADNPADDTYPRYSPDGRLLAFSRQQVPGFYADRTRLMVFDHRTSVTRDLTDGWDRPAGDFAWSPDSRTLFGTVDDAGTRRVYRFDLSGTPPVAVTGPSSYSDLAIAGNGPVIIGLRSAFTEPPTLVSIISRTGAAIKLTDFNDDLLATLAQGRVDSVTYPGANDEPVQMWVVYPPGFTPERRWPLLMLLHGGPHDSVHDTLQWRWNAQVFANFGYVTAWPNFHGSSGFGQAFAESTAGEWAELPYLDVIRGAGWFTTQSWIDPQRMAAAGGSYGGYLATLLAGREHPFRTLVAHAPVYDLFGQYAADNGANSRRFGEHWEDRERFERNSPHLAAGQFTTPMLVIQGGQDFRVPPAHSLALFNTLQNRSVPSRLVFFPDEGHWIGKPANSVFWYESIRRWLEQYAAPGPGDPAVADVPDAVPPEP